MGDYPGSSDIDNLNQPPSGIPTISTGSYWDSGQGRWVYPGDPSYDANKANKGNSAGGGALPVGASTPATTTATTAPAWSLAAKDAGGYAQIINAIIGAYGALKSHKPQTVNDPLNDALRARIYGFIDNSPTRNMLGGMLGDYIKGNANSTWTPAPAKYGYNPYPNGVPKYDLSGILPMLQPPQPQQGTGGGNDAPGPNDINKLSSGDAAMFQQFAQQHGQPAAHQVIAILEQNPTIGVQGAIRVYQSQGQPGA